MKRFLLLLLTGVPVLCFAQSNFQKGYIVNNNRDTLKGYIDYKEWRENPSSFIFKTSLDTETKTYTVENASAWSVEGFESYRRYEVDISMSKVSVDLLSVGPDTSKTRSIKFLEVLQTGKNAVLYTYTDGLKQRFYLQGRDDLIPYELSSQQYLNSNEDRILVKGTGYIRQLSALMSKLAIGTVDDRKRLKYLPYDEKSLMKAVAVINEQQLPKSKGGSTGVRFFAGTGLNISQAIYKGSFVYAREGAINKSSYSPLLTMGIDILANPAIGKTIYRLESSLLMSKNEVTVNSAEMNGSTAKHAFNLVTITFLPQVIYNFYNTKRLKVFGGGGLGFNYSMNSNNKTTTDGSFRSKEVIMYQGIDLEKLSFSIPVTAGVVFNKRIEVSAGYAFSSAITDYSNFSITMRRYRIGVNYLFGKL